MIFGLLELSKRAYIDPSDFIKHLGLDAGQQQDAQEFSNLFLSVLEQNLQQDMGSDTCGQNGSNVIKEQFCGRYAYVTRCSNCSNASERLSDFYELDLNIQGHKTLSGSLKSFLQEEKLEGDNQYMCGYCDRKQDATRAIELKSLPPVLNLQLLRFVFDVKTGSKKKLNSCIQFPDVLDMRPYLPGDSSAVYDLNAVLIHRGASAYSGHYVAHIKGKDSQAWYKFNDEEVEKIKGRNLQLGSEEDLELKKQKTTRTPKGHHSSKNAYMLVYTKRKNVPAQVNYEEKLTENIVQSVSSTCVGQSDKTDTLNGIGSKSDGQVNADNAKNEMALESAKVLSQETETKMPDSNKGIGAASDLLPAYVLWYIEKNNEKFENWIMEMNGMREESITKGQEKQETVKAIYQDLTYVESDGDKYEWLPLSWFSKWLNDPATAPAVDVRKLMCSHNKVCPDKCLNMKCVSQRGSDQLFSMYGGEIRLQGDNSLCEKCVKNKCNIIRTKKRVAEDDKFISAIMKTNFSEKCFWIGKGSFRSWRRLAVEQLDDDSEERVSGFDENMEENSKENDEIGSNGNKSVNENMTIHLEEQSQTVSEDPSIENPDVNDDAAAKETKVTTGKEKESTEVDTSESLHFNEDLLCEKHGGLDPDLNCRRLVPESVWVRLRRYFPTCAEFDADSHPCEKCSATIEAENELKYVSKQVAADQKACFLDLFHDRKRPASVLPGNEVYVVSTEFTENWRRFVREPHKLERVSHCINSVLLCEHGGFLFPPENEVMKSDFRVTYVTPTEWQFMKIHFEVDVEIVLMCVVENEKKEIVSCPAVCDSCLLNRLNLEECEMFDYEKGVLYVRRLPKLENKTNENTENHDSNLGDPEFTEASGSGKKRSSTSKNDNGIEPSEKLAKIQVGDKMVRKSQRHRKARGEKEVFISSKSTLKELKLEIMKLFAVPPFDQNLYVDGRLLEGNECNLRDLRVASGSVIEMVADEPQNDVCFLEDISKESGIPESGFKGTNLLSTI